MSLPRELKTIQEQMKSDFESVMTGMAAQRDAVNNALHAVNNALAAQENILRGFMERTEERFGQVVDVVGRHEDAIEDLLKRVDALEKRAS